MDKEKQGKAVFVSFCIEQYAKAKNMSTEDVVNLFEQYGIAEHFCEFYEVLHTQGGQWLTSLRELPSVMEQSERATKE